MQTLAIHCQIRVHSDIFHSQVLVNNSTQPPFYGHYMGQPALRTGGFCWCSFTASMSLNWTVGSWLRTGMSGENLSSSGPTYNHRTRERGTADGNQCMHIKEKTLEFLNSVTYTVLCLHTLCPSSCHIGKNYPSHFLTTFSHRFNAQLIFSISPIVLVVYYTSQHSRTSQKTQKMLCLKSDRHHTRENNL